MFSKSSQPFHAIPPKLSGLREAVSVFGEPITAIGVIGVCLNLLVISGQLALLPFAIVMASIASAWVVWRSLHCAFYDSLTGLPNRALFMKRLEHTVRISQHQKSEFAVFLLDLDRFKLVNGSLGQKYGDRLLIAVAHRLRQQLRSTDILARVGGNEFAILLETGAEQVIQVANQLQAELTLPFSLDGQEVFMTASIGVALGTTDCTWADDFLRDAQIAMYQAKSLGRARSVVFHHSMRVQAVPLLKLETALRRAVERQELRLHYQALVSLQTGRIVGFEALVRWQHPEHGLISPVEFIPIAEDIGLIASVGRWTLREACHQLRTWQQQFPTDPPLLISVNLSSKQFLQPDLVEQVKDTLLETGLDAQTLKLEITESMVMEDIEAAIATLEQMKALKVLLGIDDFGTGYSSLSYLYRFPTDTLKIDQSFVSRIGSDCEHDQIVSTIVTLAHTLGMNVIAEGIETGEQLALLRTLKCEYGQGYFFSEPLDREEAEALMAAAPSW